jgi:hypothetical protein
MATPEVSSSPGKDRDDQRHHQQIEHPMPPFSCTAMWRCGADPKLRGGFVAAPVKIE